MDIIAMVNEKGGTGKTTSTVNLAAALGEMGKKVLLVDLDGQAATSRWLGVDGDTRFADALLRGKGLEPISNILKNVDLAPGHGKLDSVAHDLRPTQGGQLRKLLHKVEGYDFVLIDCPPSLGNRLIGNALLAATHALVPVETSVLALDGLKILLTTLEDVREGFGHDINLLGVLACRYDGRTRLSRLVLAELKRALPNHLFKTVIRENVKMRECPASGQSILQYAGDSHGAKDYRALAREMVARLDEAAGKAADASPKQLVTAVEHFEQVAEVLETHADVAADGDIPEIDGCWDAIGAALAGGDDKPEAVDETDEPGEIVEPVVETIAEEPEETAPVAVAPEPEPEPEPVPEVEPQPAAEQPAAVEPPVVEQPAPQPVVNPQPRPMPQQAPPAPRILPVRPSVAAEAAEPGLLPDMVNDADLVRDDLQTWPAEVDVVRAEMAQKTAPRWRVPEPTVAMAAVEDDNKKPPSWLRFFTGSRS